MNAQKIKTIADHYGYEDQSRMLQEECAELIQAVNKLARKPTRETIKGLMEEIADVKIMLAQVEYLLDCSEGVDFMVVLKLDRQIERIKGGASNDT